MASLDGHSLNVKIDRLHKETQEEFSLRCPMDGEYKIGRTWAETH